MFGKNSRLNPLELRKKLLLAESELNRAQLAEEAVLLTAEIHAVTHRVKSFALIGSSLAALVAGLAAFRRNHAKDVPVKSLWPQTLLKGAGLVSNLWLAFKSRNRVRENHPSDQPV